MSLLPIKPMIIKLNNNNNYLSWSCQPLILNFIYSCCFLNNFIDFYELPVIQSNQFMFDNYKHFGKEKWIIYMEVIHKIMYEISEIEISEKSYNEKNVYRKEINKIKNKKIY